MRNAGRLHTLKESAVDNAGVLGCEGAVKGYDLGLYEELLKCAYWSESDRGVRVL